MFIFKILIRYGQGRKRLGVVLLFKALFPGIAQNTKEALLAPPLPLVSLAFF